MLLSHATDLYPSMFNRYQKPTHKNPMLRSLIACANSTRVCVCVCFVCVCVCVCVRAFSFQVTFEMNKEEINAMLQV
jgi:hypothetical protein